MTCALQILIPIINPTLMLFVFFPTSFLPKYIGKVNIFKFIAHLDEDRLATKFLMAL